MKESEIYEKYATEHPQSPAASGGVVRRRLALVSLDRDLQDGRRAEEIRGSDGPRPWRWPRRAASQTSSEDWAARAQRLLYLMEQGVPTYGNVTQ